MLVLSSHSLLTRGAASKLCHHMDRSSYISQCNQDKHTQSSVSRVILDSVRSTIVKRPSHACSSRSRSKSRNGHLSVFILIVFYSRERSIGAPLSPIVKDLYVNTSHCVVLLTKFTVCKVERFYQTCVL